MEEVRRLIDGKIVRISPSLLGWQFGLNKLLTRILAMCSGTERRIFKDNDFVIESCRKVLSLPPW